MITRLNSQSYRNPLDSPNYKAIVETAEILLHWRWLLMALLSLSVFISEMDEHHFITFDPSLVAAHLSEFHFTREIVLYGLIMPIIGGIIIGVLGRTRSRERQTAQQLGRQQDLNHQLIGVLEWSELTGLLVKFPQTIAPFKAVFLLVYNQDQAEPELAAEWRAPEVATLPLPLPALNGKSLTHTFGSPHRTTTMNTVTACQHESNYYCLPLVNGQRPIALLYFYLPTQKSLSRQQLATLNGLAPSIALAIDGHRPSPLNTQAERRRIARHLHDTLAQHLGYLRFKLEQLSTGEQAQWEIAAVKQELRQMRDIANQAYEQVRGTLVSLHPADSVDLASAILNLAEAVGQQTGLKLEVSSEGRPRLLSLLTRQNILYIFQEAMINVAKHARAQAVKMNMLWTEDALIIKLVDNGRGFDPRSCQDENHFGLPIMQERAKEINGYLILTSTPGAGTTVMLWLPFEPLDFSPVPGNGSQFG